MITVSAARMTHITVGDASGGGHMHGNADPTKSKFPATWTADMIKAEWLVVTSNAASTNVLQPNGNRKRRGLDIAGNHITVITKGNAVVTAYPA